MATNDTVIANVEKAFKRTDVEVSDLKTEGGYLNPTQFDYFMREVGRGTDLLPLIRMVTMGAPEMNIDKIGIGSRFLHKATSATPLDASKRAKPIFGQVKLTCQELIGSIYIPYDVIEDNIERGTLSSTIMALIIRKAQEDMEEVGLLGDTTSPDDLLNSFDGWMKLANGHIVDFATPEAMSKDVFKRGLLAMPSKFLRNRQGMAHFIGPHAEIEYADSLTTRTTPLGDSKITGTWQGNYAQGVPVRPASVMPETKGLFCDPKNLIMGVYRNIQIETDKDIESRVYKIVMTMRIGAQIEEKDAVVRYSGLDVD